MALVPSAIAVSPVPPVALAIAPSPSAIARPKSPKVVSAVALPSETSGNPSNEMARSRPVAGAGRAPPLRRLSIDDSQSVDESAEATGVWAHATPMPNPTASTPSRAIPREFIIESSFPKRSPARASTCVVTAGRPLSVPSLGQAEENLAKNHTKILRIQPGRNSEYVKGVYSDDENSKARSQLKAV